jgi:hypothetical protein
LGGHPLHSSPWHLLHGKLEFWTIEALEPVEVQVGKDVLRGQLCMLNMAYRSGSFGYTLIYGDNGFLLQDGSGYVFRLTQLAQSPTFAVNVPHDP